VSRRLAFAVVVGTAAVAHAESPDEESSPDMADQEIGAEAGVASGGRVTAGGVRIAGHYLYRLAAEDWFDGTASFTFGGRDAACFRNRMDLFICDHGLADGYAAEVSASVRHFLAGIDRSGQFWPFVRVGVGLGIVRFGNDAVTGLILPVHAGAGARVSVTPSLAISAEAEIAVGIGTFSHSLGLQPQLGFALGASAEFRL
jgi:hypothetical protein